MPAPRNRITSLADTIVRYDLREVRTAARMDFSPEAGSQRLLKQSEISARFKKRPKVKGGAS